MKNCICIIPARSGSKGFPDKNIKLLQGFPLLGYSIAAAKLAGIERVLVSTDSKQYAEIASNYGAEVPFLRPVGLSTDTSTDFEFMRHAMEWILKHEKKVPEYWLHLRPTTPLRVNKVLKKAINKIKNNNNATSLRSGHEAIHNPLKWFQKDEEGYFRGLSKGLTTEIINMPRQKFQKVYIPNGYIDIVRSSYTLENSEMHGDKMIVFETEFCPEIDDTEDYEYLLYKFKLNPNFLDANYLQDYLNKNG